MTNRKAIYFFILIALLVFGNMLFNGFVWDDLPFIISNPDLHTFNIARLFGENSFNSSGYYRPLPAVYFSVLYTFFTTHAFFYHFFQLSLHSLAVYLLFCLLQ